MVSTSVLIVELMRNWQVSYFEDRRPTKYAERLDVGCMRNDSIGSFDLSGWVNGGADGCGMLGAEQVLAVWFKNLSQTCEI